MKWICGECRTTRDFKPEYEGDMPGGWFRIEDTDCVYIACSVKCLKHFVQEVELHTAVVAVDPHAEDSGPTPTRD